MSIRFNNSEELGISVPNLSDFESSGLASNIYGPVQILFDLNFSVAKGETLALLGTNGAGKSTILRVITGLGTSTPINDQVPLLI